MGRGFCADWVWEKSGRVGLGTRCWTCVGGWGEEALQVCVHFLESALGLLEEIVDDALAELALLFIVVHFENLLKGCGVDVLAKLGLAGRALLAL